LGNFLKKMGVKINGLGTHTIRIQGIKQVSREVKHDIIPDQIEAGTFAVLAAATKSQILIKNVNLEHLDSIISKLQQIGVKMEKHGRNLLVRPAHKLKAFKFQALPYPGLPTDLQAPFGVLATQCYGTSLIHDPLFEGRLGYIQELIKMGANAIVADSHRAIINAPTPLYGTEIKTLDLRAGATLIIAGLLAKGETIINQAEIIDRGYEKIEERLRKIGAQISRIS
jgi:UDP-N-acetylglucosamine 1-carboxyvinyltransferase